MTKNAQVKQARAIRKASKVEPKRLPEQVHVQNLKVEQVARAIYFGYDSPTALQVKPLGASVLAYFEPDELVEIGIADEYGYRLTPASNSALVTLGYHPTAVLLWLTRMRLDGRHVVVHHEGKLYAVHAAVAQCSRDVVFNYEKLAMVADKVGKFKPVVVSRPVLDNYRRHGKPKTFA